MSWGEDLKKKGECDITHSPNILHISVNCKNHHIIDKIGFPVEVGMKWRLAQIWGGIQGGDKTSEGSRNRGSYE